MFRWLRTMARNAVVAGIQDAVDTMTAPPQDGKLDLHEPVLLRLPAPVGDEEVADEPTTKRVKKASS